MLARGRRPLALGLLALGRLHDGRQPREGQEQHEPLGDVVHRVLEGQVRREVAELGVPPASARRRARDLFGSAETPGARGYKTPMPTEMKNAALAADAVGLHIMR